jgi:hypothetical protein
MWVVNIGAQLSADTRQPQFDKLLETPDWPEFLIVYGVPGDYWGWTEDPAAVTMNKGGVPYGATHDRH